VSDEPQWQWSEWLASETATIKAEGRWRAPLEFDAFGAAGLRDGRTVVSFASNDYLGLTAHPSVRAAAIEATERWGTGSGASRLVVGSRPVHHQLEVALSRWRNTESAILFPTGFAANLGLLATLGAPGVVIHSDELNHASIIDGCRMARANGARVQTYRHIDLEQLGVHLERWGSEQETRRQIVVSDTVFSMDGNVAPVSELAALCAQHGALLVVDEAHAVLESIPPSNLNGATIVQVGTLSKALGALGGFVAGSKVLIDLLVNRARSYIFTTAPSPADAAAALAALDVLQSREGTELLSRLRTTVERVKPGHPSPIIPIILGDEAIALAAAQRLLDRGLLVPAIRPPTVPVGSSRLRIALSAAHNDEQIDSLLEALDTLELDGDR
jgi:8-amino-7-oxononanoate synthase